jgi:4-amino-4-deoxy-L-arabinose transferase-like glycosyltransferase
MKKITILLLSFILVISIFTRFYKLGSVPPSISWDEAAVGYNAWSILYWGKDEWGKTLPLVFKSFADDKHPLHIYLTVPTVGLLGLNEMGVRASSALFGVLNVLIIFFLARLIFKSDLAGLISSFVLALSQYNIHFSRFNHELNFVLFFFMLGLALILKGIKEKSYALVLGFGFLGLDLLGYHSAKVVVPPMVLLVIALYFRNFMKIKKIFLFGILAFSFFVGILFLEPALLGGARLQQTSDPSERSIDAVTTKYLSHFTNTFLFVRGDANPRLSAQTGTFYKVDSVFLAIGLIMLVWGIIKGKKEYLLILFWAILALLPSSITSEAPHAARAMYMTGSWHLIIGLGIYTLLNLLKPKGLKIALGVVIVGLIGFYFSMFWKNYFGEYAKRYAIEWQYGMKQVVERVRGNQAYGKVYMDNIRQQPYIFFLFYLNTPLPEFLATVKYDESEAKSYNTVHSYGRYQFGGWNIIESYPGYQVLYVVTPSYYTGLRFREKFNVDGLIKYPNGLDAFYMVSGNEL